MTLFENAFVYHLVTELDDLQQKKNDPAKNPWHRKIARGIGAMQQDGVADRYEKRLTGKGKAKYKGELNNKIELIRSGKSDTQILSDVDLKYIYSNYNVNEIPRDKPKSVMAGIIARWDPMKGAFILQRNDRHK